MSKPPFTLISRRRTLLAALSCITVTLAQSQPLTPTDTSYWQTQVASIAFTTPFTFVIDTPNAFYPLHIGDRWNWGWECKIVGDTLGPGGKRYAKLRDPSGIQFPYQRCAAGKVYALQFWGSTDQLIYDLSASEGDTIATIVNPSDTMDIVLWWRGETFVFDRMRKQWGFWFDARRMIDEERYYVVTDSIGVTHEEGMWFNFNLRGALINGRRYGDIVHVDSSEVPVPVSFELLQNYPNPFNPITTIRFVVPVETYNCTSLRVYDLLGREIATLANEVLASGAYERTFDATGLASGVYFYRLSAGTFVETKKMLVLR